MAVPKKAAPKKVATKNAARKKAVPKKLAPKKTIVKKVVSTPSIKTTVKREYSGNFSWEVGGRSGTLAVSSSNISCGVCQLTGISALKYCTPEQIKAVLKRVIEEKNGYAWLICSCYDMGDVINSVFNEVAAAASPMKNNPNSGNNIQVWVL